MSTLKQNVLTVKRWRGYCNKNIKTPFLSLHKQANQQPVTAKYYHQDIKPMDNKSIRRDSALFWDIPGSLPVCPTPLASDMDSKFCLHVAQLQLHVPKS